MCAIHAGAATTAHPPGDRCGDCDGCLLACTTQGWSYAYLLGQYLGDGSIVQSKRGVFRLTVSCTASYPGIVEECAAAMATCLPRNVVGRRTRSGVVELSCYSKHIPCLFPQHRSGKKHLRPIQLALWQERIGLVERPDRLLRGLIHSDGCRSLNRVHSRNGKEYAYVRYTFSNRSEDIRSIFCLACDRLGVEWRQMNHCNISVARRTSVALLEEIVGAKR